MLDIDEDHAKVVDHVSCNEVFVDGLGVGDVGNVVLKDRQHLAEEGVIIIVMTLESMSGRLLAGPDIISRGFVYVRESGDLLEEARKTMNETMDKIQSKNITDWGRIKSEIKDAMGEFVWRETKRKPMIIPIIMEV